MLLTAVNCHLFEFLWQADSSAICYAIDGIVISLFVEFGLEI
jgi:hypothetical protein